VPKHQPKLRAEVLLQLLHQRLHIPAGRTLIIPILHQRPGRVGLALRVIVHRNRRRKFAHEALDAAMPLLLFFLSFPQGICCFGHNFVISTGAFAHFAKA
jgi:hypothetical protein